MPLKRVGQQRKPHSARERDEEQEETKAKPPRLEPVEGEAREPGRPYREYVENEAEKYRRETASAGSLAEPDQQHPGAAALPEPIRAQQGSPGPNLKPALTREHMVVVAMQMHFVLTGLIKPPYHRLEKCPNYVEALIQVADEANLLAREIPLPDHPPPEHPKIYYTVNLRRNWPVPKEDALIRGDYVYTRTGRRITRADYINPWPEKRHLIQDRRTLLSLGWDACYTLYRDRNNSWHILLLWTEPVKLVHGIAVLNRSFIEDLIFSPPSSFIIAVPGAE